MKNLKTFLLVIFIPILFSCNEGRQQEDREEDLEIQGEETGGMGTGPGPGVDVPLDTTENITPDTIEIVD